MSNDEVKILWKTTCKWRDTEDLAKREDIRPKNMSSKQEFDTVPLKEGDAVKIRFKQKWYDGEILESWNPECKVKDNSNSKL